jgi:hypothetical protein
VCRSKARGCFGFGVERAIYLTLLHRLMVSGSDRHAHGWHQRLGIPGAETVTLVQAYKAMAWFGEEAADGRPMTDIAEEALYRHRQPLFGELSVVCFDTTRSTSNAGAQRRSASTASPRISGRSCTKWCWASIDPAKVKDGAHFDGLRVAY